MKKEDEPSTPMSSHSAPSPPTATAGTAAAGGLKRKRKRQNVLDTVSVGAQTGEIVELQTDDKWRWSTVTVNQQN